MRRLTYVQVNGLEATMTSDWSYESYRFAVLYEISFVICILTIPFRYFGYKGLDIKKTRLVMF